MSSWVSSHNEKYLASFGFKNWLENVDVLVEDVTARFDLSDLEVNESSGRMVSFFAKMDNVPVLVKLDPEVIRLDLERQALTQWAHHDIAPAPLAYASDVLIIEKISAPTFPPVAFDDGWRAIAEIFAFMPLRRVTPYPKLSRPEFLGSLMTARGQDMGGKFDDASQEAFDVLRLLLRQSAPRDMWPLLHGDMSPRNMLFNGERVWLIDPDLGRAPFEWQVAQCVLRFANVRGSDPSWDAKWVASRTAQLAVAIDADPMLAIEHLAPLAMGVWLYDKLLERPSMLAVSQLASRVSSNLFEV